MIALISIMAVVLAIMVVLMILCFVVGIAVGIPALIVGRTCDDRWWLLTIVTAPASCVILFWLMRMIALYGGIA